MNNMFLSIHINSTKVHEAQVLTCKDMGSLIYLTFLRPAQAQCVVKWQLYVIVCLQRFRCNNLQQLQA